MSEIISRVNLGGNISPIATSNIFIASSTDGVSFTTRAEDSTITLFNGISINVLFQATPSTLETSYLAVITSSEPSAFPIRPAVGNDYAAWCANAGAPLINDQQIVNLTFLDGAWIITSVTPSRDTNTTYSSKTAASGGTATSLVTTGEKYTWNNKANGNHTHTTSIAESSGTSQVSLAHGKKYALNAGGTSYIFTMPSDNNTNQTVKGNGTAFGASDAIDIVGSGATTVTADTTNKKITISSTNTTYTDATTSKSGLMSATDKSNLNTLVNLLKDDDTGTTVNTIAEVLKVFETYPEGTDIANALASKANTADLATVATSGSYNDLSGKPSSLKNPNSITIKAGTDTVSSYDGSAAKTFTIAASSTAGAFTISDGTTTKTVQLAGKFTDNNTTYSAAKYNTLGLLKPAYTSTGAATLTTAAASNAETPTIAAKTTTSGRYYAVEADKNGIAYVNVPWSNTTYSSKTAASGGTDVSLVTTGEKYTWNNKASGSHKHTYSNTVTLTEADNGGSGNIQFVKSISGSAPSLGGTTKFVTGYNSFSGGSGSLTTDGTPTNGIGYVESISSGSGHLYSYDAGTGGNAKSTSGRIAYVADVSHTAATLTGTTTFVSAQGTFSAGSLPALTVTSKSPSKITAWSAGSATTASVANGVLTITNGSAPSLTYSAESVGSASGWSAGSLPSLGAATTKSVGINGGSISKTIYYLDHAHTGAGSTIKYLHHGHTAASLGTASTGTVSISGGSYSATTSYLSKTITSSGTTGTPS